MDDHGGEQGDWALNEKISKAANNELLQLAARLCMVTMLPLGGFIGAGVWTKVDKTNDSTIRQEEVLKNLTNYQLPNLRVDFNRALVEHDRRIGKLEDWRTSLPPKATP
jgi:hypothetical protein